MLLCMVLLLSKQKLSSIGCSSTCKDGLHVYGFPKDPGVRKKGADQVEPTVGKWEPTDHSYFYSKHFEDDCFQSYNKLQEQNPWEWKGSEYR